MKYTAVKRTAVCPGSFDPVTLGHLDIIGRCASMYDEVAVCVLVNVSKKSGMFTAEERVDMLRRVTARYGNVRVEPWDGLLAEYVKTLPNAVVVKGLRSAADYEYELPMERINRRLNPELETVFLACDARYGHVSSSAVRELAYYGAELHGYVPEELVEEIGEKAKDWRKN